jgi:hypothetical protein
MTNRIYLRYKADNELGHNVSNSLKRKIVNGEYVNFGLLVDRHSDYDPNDDSLIILISNVHEVKILFILQASQILVLHCDTQGSKSIEFKFSIPVIKTFRHLSIILPSIILPHTILVCLGEGGGERKSHAATEKVRNRNIQPIVSF